MEKKLMLIIAFCFCLGNVFASYVPITVTSGFNADVIANGVGSSANSCVPFDINNEDALVAPDWTLNAGGSAPGFSLPTSGIINSDLTTGLSFNLASYSANNTLLLTSTQNAGTIGFSATGYGKLFLLVAGSGIDINFSATINFSDGSNQLVNNLTATEWKSGEPGTIDGIGAIRIPWDFTFGDATLPSLYQVGLDIAAGNISKTITGITFAAQIPETYQSMGVFAVTGVTPCTGAPATTNVLSTATSICSGINFTLSLSTSYSDAGINYQWQRSADNMNWTNIASAGNQPTATLTQSAASYYRCMIICAFSGMSTPSSSVMVSQNPALACYCTPTYSVACDGSANSSYINSVSLIGENGTSLNNTGTGCSISSYADFTTSVPAVSLSPLQNYNLTLTANSPYGDLPYVTVWIDMNDDGFFDTTEQVGTTGNTTGLTINLIIPLSTATGNHRMRIRSAWNVYSGVLSPCSSYSIGETEDYTVNFLPAPSCIYPVGFINTPQSVTGTQLSWISNSATSYDYVFDLNSGNNPVAGSTIYNTTDTFVDLSGLVSGADYYLHVRSRCSATDSSAWFAFPFSIPDPCGATALTIGMLYSGNNSSYPIIAAPVNCGQTGFQGSNRARLFKFTSSTGNPVKISTCGTEMNDYFRVYSGTCGNFTCLGGSSTDNNCSTTSQFYTFQPIANTTYYILWGVTGNFSAGDYNIEVFEASSNDDAPGATLLTVGAGCAGPVYSNQTATASTNEPITTCSAFENSQPVWFKFIAPASGSVRISTDGATGTMNDSRIGLFSATDSSDYSTFNLLSCDDDNGITGDGLMSIIYATDLTPGNTYYVQVDNNSFTDPGSFCLTVDDLNGAMLSTNQEDCSDIQALNGSNDEYDGWITLADGAGKLVALVRNPNGGNVSDYTGTLTIKTGAARQTPTGSYYLNRNYLISNGNVNTPVDLKLFFTTDEFANFNNALAPMSLIANMSDLYVLKQSGYNCEADIDTSLGTLETLNQVNNNTTNGVASIQVSTSSFSNFYISGSNFSPLAIKLTSFEAKNKGAANQINWTTATEETGDYFELERSADGSHFSSIAKINGHQKPSGYVYFDNAPFTGLNYYRLKMIDIKGNFNYSKIVQANVSANKKIAMDVYPNPVNKMVTLKVFGTQDGTVMLTDISGRMISTSKMKGSEMQIDMSTLSNGFYLIHYSDGNLNQVIKVNKQ